MNRLIALLLALALLTGCTPKSNDIPTSTTVATTSTIAEAVTTANVIPDFTGLSDTSLHTYLEDMVYTELVTGLNNENYFIENVAVTYISKEYLEEIAYNSKENIYFGYSLSSLNEQFQGTRYVFTLGDNGETIVKEFEEYDDTFDQVLRNVAIGTGVILLCVTVSVVSGGAGAPAVAMIFAASAKTGAIAALSTGVISGVSKGIVTGIETGDFDESLKAAALAGSEGFKWGAITGSITGGATETVKYANAMKALKGVPLNGLTTQQAAAIQMETGYPISIIKQFHNMDEFLVYKNAGLQAEMIGSDLALVRSNIDLYNVVDEFGRNNFTRMTEYGLNPLDITGKPFEWHHIGQNSDATLALLTAAEHDAGALHGFKTVSEINRSSFDAYKKILNKNLANWLAGNTG